MNEKLIDIQSRLYTPENQNRNNFLQVSVSLIEQEQYKTLTNNDRIIYAVLARRVELSKRNLNRYLDQENNAFFIYYTIKQMSEYLGISENTVLKSYKNLEEHRLIQRVENAGSFNKSLKIFVAFPEDGKSAIIEHQDDDALFDESYFNNCENDNAKNASSTEQNLRSSNKENSYTEKSKKEKDIKNMSSTAINQNSLFSDIQVPCPASASEKEECIKQTAEARALTKIEQAKISFDWSKINPTDFVLYFIHQHNKVFPHQITLPFGKHGGYAVSVFKNQFIDRYSIDKHEVCEYIDKIIKTYKSTVTDPRYTDAFDISTFNLNWKIDQLMDSITRVEKYDQKKKPRREYDEDDLF